MNKELDILEAIVKLLPSKNTVTFDMSRTCKHWLLDYEYFYVRNSFTKTNLTTDTCLDFRYKEQASVRNFIQAEIEQSIKTYWSEKISIGKVELLAWSKYTVEKDTGLVYIYDKQNNCKGIFCHCMNRVEEFIYVGSNISVFFNLEETLEKIQDNNLEHDFQAVKKRLTKSQLLTYDKLLEKSEYRLLDSELGFSITFELYKGIIDEILIPLTCDELYYSNLKYVDNSAHLHFLWVIDNKEFEAKLNNSSDYIDGKLYILLNEVLEYLNKEKKFILFREFDFGQEYGVAYINDLKAKKLRSLFRIEEIKQ